MSLIIFLAYCDGHLLVFSETHLDIFNTQTADWVQSIGLKRSRPLSNHGNVAITCINELPIVIYLANMHTSMRKFSPHFLVILLKTNYYYYYYFFRRTNKYSSRS